MIYLKINVFAKDPQFPHSCLNTIYTEVDIMALKDLVESIVHDTPHLPLYCTPINIFLAGTI